MYVLRVMVEVENDELLSDLGRVKTDVIQRLLIEVGLQLKERNIQHGETARGSIRDSNGNKVCSYNFETTK
jgi:hypothetical protein